ncbi:MAG: type II secretion system protein [Vulcanimicrobiota bacterium]
MRRAFTLIEVVIVMAIMAIITFPIFDSMMWLVREGKVFRQEADLRLESRQALEHIKRKVKDGYTITSDNAGLDFRDGSKLRWQDGNLTLDGRSLTTARVDSFLVHQRQPHLVVNIVLSCPPERDRTLRYRGIYDL